MNIAAGAQASVHNYTQQNAAATQAPAAAQFDARNSAVGGETQLRQAVKVADSSNRSDEARQRRDEKQELREKINNERNAARSASRNAGRGGNVDVSV